MFSSTNFPNFKYKKHADFKHELQIKKKNDTP